MAIERTFRPQDGKVLPCQPETPRTEYVEPASGLRLRVTTAGARAWCLAYWSPSAKTARRLKLGDAAVMPLSKARSMARTTLHVIEQEGRDPYAERLAERERERAERTLRAQERLRAREKDQARLVTVPELCREFMEHRRTIPSGRYGRLARPQTLALWESMLRRHIEPAFGSRPVDTVTSADILSALEGAVKRGGPTMGPRVRDFLKAVWRWAEPRAQVLRVKLPSFSFATIPKVGADQRERERVLSPAEVWRLWRATENEALQGEALRFMLLTGARVREVTGLPWSEVDLQLGNWQLPSYRSKTARARTIPLSSEAQALLRRVQEKGTSEAVFGQDERLTDTMKRIRTAMGGEHWQPRDLRRTAATLCARLGADPFTVALMLGHSRPDQRMPAVTGIYLRWDYEDRVRKALERLGAWVAGVVGRETEPGEVLDFESGRSA